jgi:superfamily II DNA helicase RecQ
VDYKQILSPEDFAVFVKLRQWRKTAAEKEGIPVYTIFTNEQLAEIARLRVGSKTELGRIEGIGEGRLKKYGDEVLQVLNQSGVTGGSDSVASETVGEEDEDTEAVPSGDDSR